jgi:hypothetical protein
MGGTAVETVVEEEKHQQNVYPFEAVVEEEKHQQNVYRSHGSHVDETRMVLIICCVIAGDNTDLITRMKLVS